MRTLEDLSKQCISVSQVPVDISREFIVEHVKRQFQGGEIVDSDKVDGIESGRLVLLCTALKDVDHMCKEVKEEEIECEGKRFTVKYQTAIACELPERWEHLQIQEQEQQVPKADHQNSQQYAWPSGPYGALSGFYHNIPGSWDPNMNKGGMIGYLPGPQPMPGNEQQQGHGPQQGHAPHPGQGHNQMSRISPLYPYQNISQGGHYMPFMPGFPMMFDPQSRQYFQAAGLPKMQQPPKSHRHTPGDDSGQSAEVKSPRGAHNDESFELKMEVSGKKTDKAKCYSRSEAGKHPQIYCEPCSKDGIRLTAHGFCQDCMEHLCESCYETHRKPAPCRNHVLLDKTQMPKSQSADHLKVPHDLTKQCQLHKGKTIEYICHDHNIFGCSPCITLNHRNCKLDYIPDVSKQYMKSDEYRKLLRSLANLQKQFKRIIENIKANEKKILENKSLVKDEITKFRQEINNLFDKLEEGLQKHVDDIFAKESARMESLALRSVKLENDVKQLQNDIGDLEKANQLNALYIHSKENQELIQSFTSAEKQAHRHNYVNAFVFSPNINLKEILRSKAGIGELQNSGIVRIDTGYFETLRVKYSDDINVEVPSDKEKCCISGAVFIAKHCVAIVDSSNNAVKIVDTKKRKVTVETRFPDSPKHLGLLANETLAVSFPKERMITFLSIPNGLSEVWRLEVDGICNDLVYHDNRLIVTFKEPGKVQIMDLDGHVFLSVIKDVYGNKLNSPHVALDVEQNFYISDWKTCTITRMNLNGDLLKGYKDERLAGACGMVVLDDGSILVCSSKTNSIILISEHLEKSRVILEQKDGLFYPWSLALDKVQNKLYVGSGAFCKFLKVYDLN